MTQFNSPRKQVQAEKALPLPIPSPRLLPSGLPAHPLGEGQGPYVAEVAIRWPLDSPAGGPYLQGLCFLAPVNAFPTAGAPGQPAGPALAQSEREVLPAP